MTEEDLLSYIAQGDRQAFNLLYQRFQRKVFSTAFHYLQDSEDAEEITQDVFVEVYKSASTYNQKASVSTWLYRIAVNKSLDKLRYRKAKKRFAVIVSIFSDHKPAADIPDTNPNAEEMFDQNPVLQKAINTLSENQKTALILTQLEELSIKESAVIMNTTPKAVESLTQRAKANIKKYLQKNNPDTRRKSTE